MAQSHDMPTDALELMPAEILLIVVTSGLIVALMMANQWMKRIRARDAQGRDDS